MATVLVVDDDEDTRFLLGFVLERAGHRVIYAPDGEAALRVWADSPLDVVITDLAMPRRNGLRLIKEIHARAPYLPVIAMSGVSAEQLDMAQDLGARHILYKPLDPGKVLWTLEEALKDDAPAPWAGGMVWD